MADIVSERTIGRIEIIRTYKAVGEAPGPLRTLQLAAGELYWSRHVLWHLFVRDFVAGFRQKLFGYLWIVLLPLTGIASFVFMEVTGILNPGPTEIPYPIYVFIGTSVWGTFITAMTTVASGLINNADLVMRTNIPKIGLAVTGLASIAYNLLVNVVVLVLLMALFGRLPSIWGVFYPLAVIPILLVGVGVGLILSVIGAVARDVTGMFVTLVNLVMYLTPVVYTAQFDNRWLQLIVRWNPLTYLVDTPRALFAVGRLPSPIGFGLSTLLALFILWGGIHSFYLIKDKVTERL
jgi:ABC-type polysaccharide/polyol phosphate export permease